MNALVEPRRKQLDELCRRFRVRRLALFGSYVTSQFDPATSDLDFLVDFQPLPTGEHSKSYFGLLAELEALFGKAVDLVEADAIRNPYVKQEIDRTQEIVYAS
jgi:hypothetical protein